MLCEDGTRLVTREYDITKAHLNYYEIDLRNRLHDVYATEWGESITIHKNTILYDV